MTSKNRPEWPTFGVVGLCYFAWAVVCIHHAELGFLFYPAAAYLIALHSSLQHEALHGHPTRNARLNELLVFPTLIVFVPYRMFRRSHMRHHADENLTDPYDDPESWYLARRDWHRQHPMLRHLLRINQTLAGRMLVGPALSIHAQLRDDIPAILRGAAFERRAYALHAVALLIVLGFAVGIAGVPVLEYLLAAYAGMSLLMIRTFAEHQAAEHEGARTAIVEAEGVFGLLFLNNNLHAVHHANPRAPWYELPAIYRRCREEVLSMNGHYHFAGYRALFARHFLRAKEPVEHPFLRRE